MGIDKKILRLDSDKVGWCLAGLTAIPHYGWQQTIYKKVKK